MDARYATKKTEIQPKIVTPVPAFGLMLKTASRIGMMNPADATLPIPYHVISERFNSSIKPVSNHAPNFIYPRLTNATIPARTSSSTIRIKIVSMSSNVLVNNQ